MQREVNRLDLKIVNVSDLLSEKLAYLMISRPAETESDLIDFEY